MITATTAPNWYNLSDQAIVTTLGAYLRQVRLEQNLTQEQLAQKAGLSRSAISEMENGKAATSLVTIIQVLRALQQLFLLDSWQVAGRINPLPGARLSGKESLRAKRRIKERIKEESEWEWLL